MKILVLTQDNCRYCGMVKQFLDSEEIEYDTINMSVKPEYKDKYDVMGAPTVLLLDGEDVIVKSTGYNVDDLETMIDQL